MMNSSTSQHHGRTPPNSSSFVAMLLLSALLLSSSMVVTGFSSRSSTKARLSCKPSSSGLLASRETLPADNYEYSRLPRTTTTITSLPSFRLRDGENPLAAAYARMLLVVAQPLAMVAFSLTLAVGMVAWEDYGAENLWPSRRMIVETTRVSHNQMSSTSTGTTSSFGARTVHGLAFNKKERLQLLQQDQQQLPASQQQQNQQQPVELNSAAAALLPDIRTYNEIGDDHRGPRVDRWHAVAAASSTTSTATANSATELLQKRMMEEAVTDLQQVLLEILQLQTLAQDYQWDQMHTIIQSSIGLKLEPAATVLRLQLNNNNNNKGPDQVGYEEIGFDWGSCAWRHCGALADSQESLDELDSLLGVLEPPECLFCLNVAERSLRDMLAVVPAEYNALGGMPKYIAYQSAHASSSAGEDYEYGDETDLLDQDYLRMLKELRTSNDDDGPETGDE